MIPEFFLWLVACLCVASFALDWWWNRIWRNRR